MKGAEADEGVWIYAVHIMQPSAVQQYFKVKIFKIHAQKRWNIVVDYSQNLPHNETEKEKKYLCGLFRKFPRQCEQLEIVDLALNSPENVTKKNRIFMWNNP